MNLNKTKNHIFHNWVRKNYQEINKNQRQELIRKGFHFCAVFYIIGYYFLPPTPVIWIMGVLLFLIVSFEFSRLVYPKLNKWWLINFFVQGAYRREEIRKPSVLPFTFGGAFFTMLLFTQRPIVLAALCYQVFGDSISAIIGQKFGKIKLIRKTLEGSLACFLVCFLIGIFFFNYKIALLGAMTATIVELFFPYDNLFLPIISAFTLKYLIKYFTI
jgi:dolichol kinase